MAEIIVGQRVSDAEFDALEEREQLEENSEKALSESRRRRQARQGSVGPRVTTLDYEGEPWHLVRLNFSEQLVVGFLTARGENNEIDIENEDILASFAAALLFVVCVHGAEDETPFFESLDEAQEWVDDPACDGVVTWLFNAALMINPRLMANVKRPKARTVATTKQTTATVDWRTMMTPPASTTGDSPATGSETSGSTDKPATSPPDETNSNDTQAPAQAF